MKAKLKFLIGVQFFRIAFTGLFALMYLPSGAQNTISLEGEWYCKNIQEVGIAGEELTKSAAGMYHGERWA